MVLKAESRHRRENDFNDKNQIFIDNENILEWITISDNEDDHPNCVCNGNNNHNGGFLPWFTHSSFSWSATVFLTIVGITALIWLFIKQKEHLHKSVSRSGGRRSNNNNRKGVRRFVHDDEIDIFRDDLIN
jgi:hypothetical protein